MPLRIGFDLDGVLADMDGELARHAERLFGVTVARRSEPAEPPSKSDDSPAATADNAAARADEVAASADEVGASAVHSAASTADSATSTADASPDSPRGEPPTIKLELTSRQTTRLWRHAQSIENFWETLPELEPGVINRLAALASDRRWELIFLTKRPKTIGATAQVQTQRWLESKGFTLPSVYVVHGSRGRIAAALGLDIVVDDRPENCLDVVVDSRARAILVWRDDEKLLPAAARRLGIGVVKSVAEALDILAQVDTAARERQSGLMDRVMRALGLKNPASA